jgi:site-specific DNA-methyltransferase (adenine-specific)
MINLMLGDCLERMKEIPDGGVDMILCDLPYGTTYAKWDNIIPMVLLWKEYERVCKDGAAIVLHGAQPFTSMLICSKPEWYRTSWVWNKENPTNFANANKHPLKQHEDIIVFGVKPTVYYPQKVAGKKNHKQGNSTSNNSETRLINARADDDLSGLKFPKSILNFPKHSSQCGLHPTQKPVDLAEYIVLTYSLEGQTILDNTMGSGTTGVACKNLNRNFIGIEKDEKYFEIAKNRIYGEQS